MKFLVDAQLPARLARFLTSAGHDAVHTSDVPGGNLLSDREIADAADADDRIVITKDRDFRDSHLLRSSPRRLLVVGMGNCTNHALLTLFGTHVRVITSAFAEADYVEVTATAVLIHDRQE